MPGSGTQLGAPVEFLDTRPAQREDWLLIGCERSVQFHRHFYGDEPDRVDLCPRTGGAEVGRGDPHQVLPARTRARGGRRHGRRAVGANLDEVREGLRKLL